MRTLKTIWHLTVKEWRSLFGDPMLVLMIVFVFSAILILPIPWTFHWYTRWFMRQFSLESRS